jgi:hypothetical protein
MIYVPSFIKTGSSVQELLEAGYTYRERERERETHTQKGNVITLLLLFQNKKCRLNIKKYCDTTPEGRNSGAR